MIFLGEAEIKIRRHGGFTVLPNEVLRDADLNLQTKGLFCMMLSYPPDWTFSIGGLTKDAGCGRDKIRSALKNLEEAGYLIREQVHAENGHFSGNCYVLQDWKSSPLSGFPTTEKPTTENPSSENPTVINKDYKKERDIPPIVPQGGRRKKDEPKRQPDWKPERFAGLWGYYPHDKRGNKQKAIAAWDKLKPSDDLINDIGRRLKLLMASESWQAGVGIPHVSTFLNQRRWEDADNLDGHTVRPEPREEVYGWQM